MNLFGAKTTGDTGPLCLTVKKTTRLFCILSLFIALSDTLFIWINFRFSDEALSNNLQQIGQKIKASFFLSLDATEQHMLQISSYIASDRRVQQLFLKGKKAVENGGAGVENQTAAQARRELFELVGPSRDALASLSDFRQLHVHLGPGSLSFLRIHAPEKFGDRMDNLRYSVVTTNRTQSPVTGIETGRVYTGIRGVAPVFAVDGENGGLVYVGALESGTSFRSSIQAVAKKQQSNLAVLLRDQHLKATVWPEYYSEMMKNNPSINGYYVEDTTDPIVYKILSQKLIPQGVQEVRPQLHRIDGRPYCIGAFNLQGFREQANPDVIPSLGLVVIWRDVSRELAIFHHNIKFTFLYALIAFLLFELLLYWALYKSTEQLEKLISIKNNALEASFSELQKSQEHYQAIAENTYNWEEWIGPDGEYLYIAPACERISGYSRDEFIADRQLHATIIHHEDRHVVSGHHRQCQANQLDEQTLQYRIICKNGETRWVSHNCRPIFNAKGHSLGRRINNHDITKLKKQERLEHTLQKVEQIKSRLETENISLKQEIDSFYKDSDIIGNCEALQKVYKQVAQVAPTNTTVLIQGETGVGKGLFARFLHDQSKRKDSPFVIINCASLPASLIESELFGYEKGAFTGADTLKPGQFELAQGGTLFLDEIGELPLELQPKLLHALEEGLITRIGGQKPYSIDIRLIAATNQDLASMVQENRFRSDLFFRLQVFPIIIPSLRDRKEDIPPLVHHFVAAFNKELNKGIDNIPAEIIDELVQHEWPGNVRELRNLLERTVILSQEGKLELPDIPSSPLPLKGEKSYKFTSLADVERDHILTTLRSHNWRIGGSQGAAKILDIHPNTLRSRMKKLGILRPS